MRKCLSDIRFWILLFFIIRLYGITNPPLETLHTWRQTTVTMVARNFYEVDNNIFYPRVDMAGEKTGITGMEFPLLNYLIYLFSEIFGYQHWYGRLINLIITSLGIWFFFKLIRKYYSKRMTFYASIILMTSLWFIYARKIMPDTFSLSLVIMGMYYGTNYLDRDKSKLLNLILYAVLITLGGLSKIPSGFLLGIFIIFMIDKRVLLKNKIIFSAVSILSLIPTVYWYFKWIPYLNETYGYEHFFMGKSFSGGIKDIFSHLPETMMRFVETPFKFIGFGVFIIGIYFLIKKKERKVYAPFLLLLILFIAFVFKSGRNFYHHDYYILPFIPVMSLIIAYALDKIKNYKLSIFLLALIAIESILNTKSDFNIKSKKQYIAEIEGAMDEYTQLDDLIMINSGEYPTLMYFAHRKGWVVYPQNIDMQWRGFGLLKNLKFDLREYYTQLGLKYILLVKKNHPKSIEINYPTVYENEYYSLYKID